MLLVGFFFDVTILFTHSCFCYFLLSRANLVIVAKMTVTAAASVSTAIVPRIGSYDLHLVERHSSYHCYHHAHNDDGDDGDDYGYDERSRTPRFVILLTGRQITVLVAS